MINTRSGSPHLHLCPPQTFILAGERFTIGDNMLIKGAGKGTADYVAKLEKISTNQAGEVFLDTRWYYRPEVRADAPLMVLVDTPCCQPSHSLASVFAPNGHAISRSPM